MTPSPVDITQHSFSEWIDNGHNDFSDENTIILKVEITDEVLLSHGTRYERYTTNE